MPDSDAPDRYAVVGNPVAHSLSPRIHAEFARQTGQWLSYEAIEIATDAFAAGVANLQRQGYRGLNVTVPFKREAWELCDSLSNRAEIAGAVNTLILGEDGAVQGDNTDGVGLVRDLVHNLEIDLADKHILLLGAGGAARGVLEPLLAESPASLTIANRTLDRAHALARDFKHIGEIQVFSLRSKLVKRKDRGNHAAVYIIPSRRFPTDYLLPVPGRRIRRGRRNQFAEITFD